MDTLDIRILRELSSDAVSSPLHSDIRKSFGAIATKLKIDDSTVRSRVEKLRQTGFLRGWGLFVNPHLLGYKLAVVWLEAELRTSKDSLISKLRLLEGVTAIVNYFGPLLVLVIFYDTEQSFNRKLELIREISGSENLLHAVYRHPECQIALAQTDWRIIRSLQQAPKKLYRELSQDLGLSTRTIKRRLRRMLEAGALFIIPSLDPPKLEGAILADLLVSYESPESKRTVDDKIKSHFDQFLIVPETAIEEYGSFHFCTPNVSRAHEILNWVKEQPGAKSVRLDLVQDRAELYDLVGELIGKLQGRLAKPSKITKFA